MVTYVNDLRLSELATGEGSGTWGTTTNTNLELIGEALGYATEGITTNADTHATTVADGSTDPGRAMYIKYTGTLDSACTITIGPNTLSRVHIIENATSGSQNIIIKQGSGAEITIPNGYVKAVYLDGAGSGAAVTEAFDNLSVGTNFRIGNAAAEDTSLVFDGNAKDFYIGLDDSADKLVIGEGSTVGTNNILTITDDTVTIGDGAAADTAIVFDGNAQDFYIGLDDSADDLIIGLGSTVGTTPIISIDENKDVAIPDGGLTITTDDNTTQLTLTSTDDDASTGPKLDLFRDSGSPADDDILGKIRFLGDNDANSQLTYADIESRIVDASNGSEDGRLELSTALAGSGSVSRIFMNATETIINNDSKDLDFRVESDSNANRFIIDAGTDKILIGNTTTRSLSGISSVLSVEGTGYNSSSLTLVANSADSNGAYVMIGKSRGSSVGSSTALQNGDQIGGVYFNAADGTDINHAAAYISARIYGDVSGNDIPGLLQFATTSDGSNSPTEKLAILPSGGITFNGDRSTANALNDYEEGSFTMGVSGATFSAGNYSQTAYYTKIGQLVNFYYYTSNYNCSSASGTATFTGLPFTSKGAGYTMFQYLHGTGVDGNTTGGYVNVSNTTMVWVDENSTSLSTFIDGSTKYIMVQGQFVTDS